VVKNFYQTNNKNETCRRFDEQFNRQVRRETVAGIVDRFEEYGTVDDKKRSDRPIIVRTVVIFINCILVKLGFLLYQITLTPSTKKIVHLNVPKLGKDKRWTMIE